MISPLTKKRGNEIYAMKKYAQVGCGLRGRCYAMPIIDEFSDCAELFGLCDTNHKRAELIRDYARTKHNKEISVYTDFDAMLEETKPDAVIITTPDCYHDFYAIKAMRTCVADIKNRARIKEAMICTQKCLNFRVISNPSILALFFYESDFTSLCESSQVYSSSP